MGEKYLKIVFLKRNLHQEYIKNTLNIKYNEKQIIQFLNGLKVWIDISPKNIQMTNKHMKRCWTSLAIRGKAHQSHFKPSRMAVTKKVDNKTATGEDVEIGTLIHCWWNVQWYTAT